MTDDAHHAAPTTGVAYRLVDRDGPPVMPGIVGWCWWCAGPAHPAGWRACPLVLVPVTALSPERRAYRELLS